MSVLAYAGLRPNVSIEEFEAIRPHFANYIARVSRSIANVTCRGASASSGRRALAPASALSERASGQWEVAIEMRALPSFLKGNRVELAAGLHQHRQSKTAAGQCARLPAEEPTSNSRTELGCLSLHRHKSAARGSIPAPRAYAIA